MKGGKNVTSVMPYVIFGAVIFVGTVLGEVAAYIIVPPKREGELRLFRNLHSQNSQRFLSREDTLVC
jgi:hypothetical protein